MKKIFILTFSLIISAFTYQSCTSPANSAAEWAKIDSLANMKVMAYTDSLQMACMSDVMTKAKMMSDSMMTVAMSKKSGSSKKTTPKTPAAPSNPKSDKMSGSKEASTQEKKDKMENSQESTTQKKKDKMSKGTEPNPKF